MKKKTSQDRIESQSEPATDLRGTDRDVSQAAGESLPTIHPEPDAGIRVGAGGALEVPREDLGAGIDDEAELDLAGMAAQKVRKPGRREWVALNPALELPTRLLLHKPNPDGIEVEHYYVTPGLRAPIRDELKVVRVFPFYSFLTKTHALWIVTVTPENSWYESLVPLFQQPPEFFSGYAVRVVSDKPSSRYRVKYKPLPGPVTWPDKATQLWLGEALGASRFITSPDHPLYADLTEGDELR